MTISTAIRATLALVATLLLSASADAQVFRAYLAATGNDANPCTLQQPCRLLPAALTAVADGGEIWMLESANYNSATVNIPKSVTIMAVPGIVGSVVATGGGSAIYINTPGVAVALRNLVIVPLPGGGGTHGIEMANGAALTVENCLVANLASDGIIVGPGAIRVRVTDTTIRGNGNSGMTFMAGVRGAVTRTTISGNSNGFLVSSHLPGVTTTVDMIDSTVSSHVYGIYASSSNATAVVRVSVRGSLISRNSAVGLLAESSSGQVSISASDNTISTNANGIHASGAGARVWASANTVSDNTFWGIANSSALFESAGDNAVRNNGTNKNGTITVVTME